MWHQKYFDVACTVHFSTDNERHILQSHCGVIGLLQEHSFLKKSYGIADLHTTPGRLRKRRNDIPSIVHTLNVAHRSSKEGGRSCLCYTTHSRQTTKEVAQLPSYAAVGHAEERLQSGLSTLLDSA